MTQRKIQVLAPAPHLSPAFRIPRAFYDRPGAASLVLEANLDRLTRLAECQQAIVRILRDPVSSIVLQINSGLDTCIPSRREALLQAVFKMAVQEMFTLNSERVHQALQIDTSTLPAEHERRHAIDLYAARPDATWQEIGEARETYHATEWLLGYAASAVIDGEPISISHALIEASAGLIPTPQPELEDVYQRWGALVLGSLPRPDDCLD